MIGMIVSPKTGQKVLGFKQTSPNQIVMRDDGNGTRRIKLNGDIGDRFNYVTLQNYGKGEICPIPISKKRKRR